jgi:hypothetical protein
MKKESIRESNLFLGVECCVCGEYDNLTDMADDLSEALVTADQNGWMLGGTHKDGTYDGPVCPQCAKDCEEYWTTPHRRMLEDGRAYLVNAQFFNENTHQWHDCVVLAIAADGECDFPYIVRALQNKDKRGSEFLAMKVRVRA